MRTQAAQQAVHGACCASCVPFFVQTWVRLGRVVCTCYSLWYRHALVQVCLGLETGVPWYRSTLLQICFLVLGYVYTPQRAGRPWQLGALVMSPGWRQLCPRFRDSLIVTTTAPHRMPCILLGAIASYSLPLFPWSQESEASVSLSVLRLT